MSRKKETDYQTKKPPREGICGYVMNKRAKRRLLYLLSSFVMFSGSPQAKDPKPIAGAQQQISGQSIEVKTPFCNNTVPYKFKNPGGEITYTGTDFNASSDVKPQREAIRDLNDIEDKGGAIIDTDNQDAAKRYELTDQGGDASRLLVRSFVAGTCGEKRALTTPDKSSFSLLNSDYYIINLVAWEGTDDTLKIKVNNWYLFNTKKQNLFRFRFESRVTAGTRIYGSKTVRFLAVHLVTDKKALPDLQKLQITYNVNVSKTQAANVQDLLALIGVFVPFPPPPPAGVLPLPPPPPPLPPVQIGFYGGGQLQNINSLPSDIKFALQVKLNEQPKNPSDPLRPTAESLLDRSTSPALYHPASHETGEQSSGPSTLQRQGSPTGGAGQGQSTGGTGQGQTQPADCSIAVTGQGGSTSCSLSQTYNDDGLYNWDVSVGLPFESVKTGSYSGVGGALAANSVTKYNAYGFFDFYPVKTDIIAPPVFGGVHVMAGLPFSGKVFNTPFLGGGGILNIFQIPTVGSLLGKVLPVKFDFFGGVLWDRVYGHHRVWKGQVGVEFSIQDVKSKLTGGSGTGTSQKSGSKTSGSQQ